MRKYVVLCVILNLIVFSNLQARDKVEINYDNYYSFVEQSKDTISVSDYDYYKLYEFTRLKNDQTHFKYYILDVFNINSSFKTLLIAEYYLEENACWLVNYDRDNKVISAYEVFYDNSEGFFSITSSIDADKGIINIRESNIYNDPEDLSKTILIDQSGKFVEK